MSTVPKPPRSLRRAGAVLTTAVLVGGSLTLGVTAASAAPDVITVTNTDECDVPGSFANALAEANASVNPDGVSIVFDAALTGSISFPNSTCKMWDQSIGFGNELAGASGARFLIDSEVPVTVDFTGLEGITTTTDADFAGIYVRSDDVVLENLANMKAGAAGIAIDGTNVTVRNVEFKDADSVISEVGVALLNGATNVTISDSVFHSQWWSSILIDGSQANPTTVTNIVIDSVTSRGVESSYGHLDIEDGAVVNGLSVTNSTFGASDESSTTHAVYINPAVNVTGLNYSGNTVLRGTGAERNVFYFEGSGSGAVFTDTVIDGNTFTGVSTAQPLSRIIGDNAATWNGLEYTNNVAEFTRGIRMSGAIADGLFDGNTFTNMREPSDAGLTLGRELSDVTVSNNLFDTMWAHDAISVEGTSATNVVIENNRIHDFYADVSRSAIGIDVVGTGNVVRGNELVTDLDRDDLPSNIDNHWAIYFRANAADADTSVGWSILNNHIDGFGGKDRSEAPIVHNGIGKLLVTGNTFGPNTRGSVDVETEHSGYWFLWNVWDNRSNNTVQTYRAENVTADGANATFTAVKPENEPGNNDATAPVTLHVYWTAADNAEVYLGAIADVTPGQTVTIPTSLTNGFIRLQTVDASGNASQYSSIEEIAEATAPAAPAVTTVTPTEASGTGVAGAIFTVRDASGAVVATGEIGENGEWSVAGLTCGAEYTVTQTVRDIEGPAQAFTTAACPTDGGTEPGTTPGTVDLANTGAGTDVSGLLIGALLFALVSGFGLILAARRKTSAE